MPTDIHGQVHAGSLGLYDDAKEQDDAAARAERHERAHLEGVIRRQIRREKRRSNKDHKAAERLAAGKSKHSWLRRVFSGEKSRASNAEDGNGDDDGYEPVKLPVREREDYAIVRRPVTPDPVYTIDDVDPEESLWLKECGMVRVLSDDPGGCHIVPASCIQRPE